jgi:hypothetical protein
MSETNPQRPRLDGTITVGNLLQIGTIAAGIVVYLVAGTGKVDQTARELGELKTQVNAQASSTREQLQSGLSRLEGPLASVNQQLMTLPPMSERLRRAEADIARLQEADSDLSIRIENRRNVVDQRIDAIRTELHQRFTIPPPDRR